MSRLPEPRGMVHHGAVVVRLAAAQARANLDGISQGGTHRNARAREQDGVVHEGAHGGGVLEDLPRPPGAAGAGGFFS